MTGGHRDTGDTAGTRQGRGSCLMFAAGAEGPPGPRAHYRDTKRGETEDGQVEAGSDGGEGPHGKFLKRLSKAEDRASHPPPPSLKTLMFTQR